MAEGKIFVSYSHQDAKHREALARAATRLKAVLWYDHLVDPGKPGIDEIRRNLDDARLVLALVSPDFLASEWCQAELGRAFELRDRRLLDVVPIVLRQCAWRETLLGAIQALPAGGTPVESCPDPDAAWADVVTTLDSLLAGNRVQPALPARAELVRQWSESLERGRRLMLLAPWQDGLRDLANEIARRTHGDAVTTLCVPACDAMDPAQFYASLSNDAGVNSSLRFREWLMRKCGPASGKARHLVVLPYFGGPAELVKELGRAMRGVFDEQAGFSLLVFGQARCAELLSHVKDYSLFTGIMTEHVPGMDEDEAGELLRRAGADPIHAKATLAAGGGHPEWTALVAPEVRAGRLTVLDPYLDRKKVYGVLRDRLTIERGRPEKSHAGTVLERLLRGEHVVCLDDVRDDLSYAEVRLYYDGVLVARDDETVFRCPAARLAELARVSWTPPI